jgi:hypothetical protein
VQISEANLMAKRRRYPHQLDPAFVGSLRKGAYPITRYTAFANEDFVRAEIAVGDGHTVRLDIEASMFHALDRAPNRVASVPVLLEVSLN